ncbi:MAG: RloB family protein [Agrobacterium cavarae]
MAKDRNFSLGRKTKTRQPYKQFIIFSEGLNTEPEYFKALAETLSKVLVKLKVFGGEGAPSTLAETAVSYIRGTSRRRDFSSFEKSDQVWIVFDRDEHHKVKETIDNYKAAGVRVAYSNPCFELWLTLHISDFDKAYDRFKMQNHLAEICPSYSTRSGKSPDCKSLVGSVELAEQRAAAMRKRREDEGANLGCPYTDVSELTSAMRAASA